MEEKKLSSNVIFNVLYNVINIIFPFVASMYVSHILMADGVGKVSYAQNIVSYFVTVAAIGLPTYGVKAIAKVRREQFKLNKTFTELIVVNALTTTLAILCYLTLIFCNDSFRGEIALNLGAGLLLFFNYLNVDWFYRGCEKYAYITYRSFIIKIISLLCLFVFVHHKNDYVIYAIITSLASGGNYVCNVFHARHFVKFDFENINIKKHIIPLVILGSSIFLSNIYNKIDTTMLGMMSTDANVGYYVNAHKIIDLIITACTAIPAAFLPKLSYYWLHDKETFDHLVKLGVDVLLYLSVPATVGVFLIAPKAILILYGASFEPTVLTVRIFAILIVIRSIGNLLCYQLVICTGNERMRLPADSLALIVNIVLNSYLIPIWYHDGAAIASVVCECTVNILLFVLIIKKVNIKFEKKSIITVIISSIAMGVAVYIILLVIEAYILGLFISVVSGIIIYIVVSLILKNEMAIIGYNKLKRVVEVKLSL